MAVVMRESIDRARRYLAVEIWKHDLRTLPFLRALVLRAVRIVYLAIRGTFRDKAFLRASTLTYVTLLSLPPVLALAFGVGRSLGVTQDLREFVFRQLGAENQQIREVVQQIFDYVESTPLSVFNGIGLLLLFAALVKLLGTIETSFNEIFGGSKSRTFLRKVSDYLSVLIIAPVLLTVATGTVTSLRNQDLVKSLEGIPVLGAIVSAPVLSSFVTAWLGFIFLFLFMPNVRVRFSAAAVGSLVASLAWLGAYQSFLNLQIGLSRTNIIYGSFAGLPLMLIWLNASWGIVLIGAEVVAALQNEAAFKRTVLAGDPTAADRERFGLQIMLGIAREFSQDRGGRTVEDLVEGTEVPYLIVRDLLASLERNRLLARTADKPARYLLCRDPRRVKVSDVLLAIRGRYETEEGPGLADPPSPDQQLSREILVGIDSAVLNSPHDRSLHDLVGESTPPPEQTLLALKKKRRLDS